MGLQTIFAHCLNAFLISLALCVVMGRFALRIGFVDIPDSRKRHDAPVPLVGFAVFLAFASSLILVGEGPTAFAGLFAGLAAIVLVGVVDDKLDLRAPWKLLGQILCVAVVIRLGGTHIVSAGNIYHGAELDLKQWALPVTIFAMVGMINAINMIDGLDGLAGGISLGSLACFAAAAALLGRFDQLLLILLLGGSLLGFLVLNLRHPWRRRASVFLGDSGSMMLGLVLAVVAINLSQQKSQSISPIAALWICGLPVIDTVSLIIRRLAAGQNPMASDRRHLHYLLVEAGFSVGQTVAMLAAVNLAMGAIGLLGWYLGISDEIMLASFGVPLWVHGVFISFMQQRNASWKRVSH